MITRRKALIALAAPALLLPSRRILRAATCVSSGVPVNPATGTFFPYSGNTGYQSYSGFTGALTTWPGGSFTAGHTYNNYLFDAGTGTITINAANVTFNGCYFGQSSGATSKANPPISAGGITWNYCTFGPSPSVVGGAFPPLPQGGGGYTHWPSSPTAPTSASNDGGGYQYGPGCSGVPPTGGYTLNHCDIWACGNGNTVFQITSSNPVTYNFCWYHDPRFNSAGDHQDGIGDVQSASNDFVTALTINGCTVAANGNTQGLAMQTQSNFTLNNMNVTNNFWAGFGFTWEVGAIFPAVKPTNYVITGNVFGPSPVAVFGLNKDNSTPVFSVNGSGSKWRNNTFLGGSYTSYGTVPAGYFMWPDGSANATDFTGPF